VLQRLEQRVGSCQCQHIGSSIIVSRLDASIAGALPVMLFKRIGMT
jgi:hypothetical protein